MKAGYFWEKQTIKQTYTKIELYPFHKNLLPSDIKTTQLFTIFTIIVTSSRQREHVHYIKNDHNILANATLSQRHGLRVNY